MSDFCIHVYFSNMNESEESEEGGHTSKPPLSWEHGHQSKAESWIWTSNHLLSISELHFSIISVNKTSCLCCDEAQRRRDPVLPFQAVSRWLVTSLWVILWTLKAESSLLRKGKELLNRLLNTTCQKVLTTWWLVVVLFRSEKNQETSDNFVKTPPDHFTILRLQRQPITGRQPDPNRVQNVTAERLSSIYTLKA